MLYNSMDKIKEQINLIVDTSEEIRIDKYLANLGKFALYSRSFIDKLIKQGLVLVDNEPVKKSHLVKNRQKVQIKIPFPIEQSIQPENIKLDIVYEDSYLAIINKPAGMVVHPSAGHYKGTLVNALLYNFKYLSSGYESDRPGIVHRLDKETSGLLIVAKDDYTHSLLGKMLQEHLINRYYKALVAGIPEQKQGTIKTNYGRNKYHPNKMCVKHNGKVAITHYKIETYFPYSCLLKINLETGRTHQIRVHLAYIKHPILGEKVYANDNQILEHFPQEMRKKINNILVNYLPYQALHSYKLEFIHPITEKEISVKIELPDNIKKAISILDNLMANA